MAEASFSSLIVPPRLVILETPFAGNIFCNVHYARACMHDCLLTHHEFPLASHLLYTQSGVLDDSNPQERQLGIEAGLAWAAHAQATVVYTDLGISRGMEYGIAHAKERGRQVILRALGPDWERNHARCIEQNKNHPFILQQVCM